MNYLQKIRENSPINIKTEKEVKLEMKQKITKKRKQKENSGISTNNKPFVSSKIATSGITLVALVVTIVVLLILAGITINMLMGDNGIIRKAQEAKDKTMQDVANTEQGLQNLANFIDELDWDLSKVDKVVVDGQSIPVPKGYSLSKATGENSVATGLVLYEGEEEVNDDNVSTAQTSRNQFVWVPVPDITKMAKLQEGSTKDYMGMLYDFGFNGTTGPAKNPPDDVTYSATGWREPDTVVGSDGMHYDGVPANLTQAGVTDVNEDGTIDSNDFKTQLQDEFNSMVESVKLYKGFYIGRYETSGLSDSDTTVTPTVQKGKTTINNTTWYRMYKESKNIKETKTNVTSSMIWGCQWDATLRWFLTSTDEKVKTFVTDSTGKGNYTGTQEGGDKIIPTGSNPAYAVNNIYDMAGNVYEWTLEADYTYSRVHRRRYSLLFRL